jgi:hypothetical protein
METNLDKNSKGEYVCKMCDYSCSKMHHMKQHFLTSKHKKNENGNVLEIMETKAKLIDDNKKFTCECGKTYKNRDGLWKHKKKCKKCAIEENAVVNEDLGKTTKIDKQLLIDILQQNQEFKDLILEQSKQNQELQKNLIEIAKEGKYITNNNTTNNNRFSMNIFLNEQCKDALNIMDFVNSLQLQLKDLERVGEIGYVEGISKIFVNGLKELDVFKRPIHCSDAKRETLYVKDKNVWEKENQKNDRLKLAIKHIAHKNMTQIPEWQQENPDYKNAESEVSEQYMKIVYESTGGYTSEEDDANYNKIISKVAKETAIDKGILIE